MIRTLMRLRANIFGYFTLPCPQCGAEFYGFQVNDETKSIPSQSGDAIRLCVCPACSALPQIGDDNG